MNKDEKQNGKKIGSISPAYKRNYYERGEGRGVGEWRRQPLKGIEEKIVQCSSDSLI